MLVYFFISNIPCSKGVEEKNTAVKVDKFFLPYSSVMLLRITQSAQMRLIVLIMMVFS
jgi:hypothetical protein